MIRHSLFFVGPRQVDVQEQAVPEPAPGQVLVRTIMSAISPGTEMLVYRDQVPKGMAADSTIEALEGEFEHPFKYGYAAVGEVIQLGAGVDHQWLGTKVFAFNPHESHFTTHVDNIMPLPEGMAPDRAIFLPNMETAVNFIMDGRPMIGERAAILGQGIVGLLTTALLARFPLAEIVSFDTIENRRQASRSLGASEAVDPGESLQPHQKDNFDLIFELSGAPPALNTAIALAGFESRIIIGSWYGVKRAHLDLGGQFHRNRVQLISSQVSTIAAQFQGRWDKARRLGLAWKMLADVNPAQFITHRFDLSRAAAAYHLLDTRPQDTIQIVIEY